MAFHNANYKAITMTAGTYGIDVLGNGLTASTVHQVFCAVAGTVTISAMGGGEFTWAATAGQKVDVVASKIIVSSGTFVGFKANYQPTYGQTLLS